MSAGSIADAAALIWPAPARVHVTSRRSERPSSEPGTITYALVPGPDDPRLAVPLRPRAAAAAVAAGQAAAGSGRTAVRNRLMALAFRTGAAGMLLPGRLVVSQAVGAADGLDASLQDVLGQRVYLGLRVGPPRANRKPVLQIVSARGALLAYGKVGTNPLTDRLVEAETATLRRLAGAPLGEVRIPAVLHAGSWHGHPLLVQEPLPGRRAGPPGGTRLTDAMVAVSRTGAAGPVVVTQLPWWERTAAAVRTLAPSTTADRLASVQERLASAAAGVALASAAWHGDWNAGNCSVVPGAVLVWDWERYETGVPAGFDALHLHLQSALSAGVPPAEAARRVLADAGTLTAPFGVDPRDAELTGRLYLWGIGVRYAADDQDAAGAAVGRLDTWLLPVLESALGTVPAAAGGPASAGAEPKEH